ncbi:MAG: hypothetical protein ACJ76Y_09490 [Thermoanaerobaculia bacterium]
MSNADLAPMQAALVGANDPEIVACEARIRAAQLAADIAALRARLTVEVTGPLLRAVMGDLTRYGLRKLPHGPIAQIRRDARIPLIDVGTIKLIARGSTLSWREPRPPATAVARLIQWV